MAVLVPASLSDALAALAARPEAQVLAGGTDFMVEVNFGHRRPSDVVAVDRVPELRGWARRRRLACASAPRSPTREMLEPAFAALAAGPGRGGPHRRLAPDPQRRHHRRQPRHLLAGGRHAPGPVGPRRRVESPPRRHPRVCRSTTSWSGAKRTALRPGELVAAVTVPVAATATQGFAKVGVRNAMVISVASACLVVDRRRGRSASPWRGRADHPAGPRRPRRGSPRELDWDGDALGRRPCRRSSAELAAAAARPIDDHRSTAAYRRHAVGGPRRRACCAGRFPA